MASYKLLEPCFRKIADLEPETEQSKSADWFICDGNIGCQEDREI